MCGFTKNIYPNVCKGHKTADIAQCPVIYVGTKKDPNLIATLIVLN